jgi:hypothetical protein
MPSQLLVSKEAIFYLRYSRKTQKIEVTIMLILEEAKMAIGLPPKSGLFNHTIFFIPPQTGATVPLTACLKHLLKKAV